MVLIAKEVIHRHRDMERRAALEASCGGRFPAKRPGFWARLIKWICQ